MSRIILLVLLSVFFVSCTKPTSLSARVTLADLPDAPSYKRAWELLSVVNVGSKNSISDYLTRNAATSMHDAVDFLVMVHQDTFRLNIEKIEATDDTNSAKLLLKSQITGLLMNFSITVDDKPPHKIAGISLDFADIVPQESEKISVEEAVEELREFFIKVCKVDMFSGSVLISKNDKVLFQGACGEANKDFSVPNNIDTKFNLGSMNKMFTALAIAQLVEQGKLSFEDSLDKYMPNFIDEKSAQKVKISHLLSHSSGLGNYFNEKYKVTPKEELKTIDNFLGLLKDEKLAFEPGTQFKYSNTGFLVLGKIIELVTKKSYFDYIDEHIYRPASMFHSGSFDLTSVNHNLAVGYNKEYTDNGYSFSNNLFQHVIKGGPAGGGYSTVSDLKNFSLALQSGKLISLAMLEKNILLPGINEHYGYGFDVRMDQVLGKYFGHGGDFIGISSDLSIFPKNGFITVVLSNYSMASLVISLKLKELIRRIKK